MSKDGKVIVTIAGNDGATSSLRETAIRVTEQDLWSAIGDMEDGSGERWRIQEALDRLIDLHIEEERAERLHWEAEHAALWYMVEKIAEVAPGAVARRLRWILEGSGNLSGAET